MFMITRSLSRILLPALTALPLAAGTSAASHAQQSPRKLAVVMTQAHDPLYVDIDSVARRGSVVSFKYVLDVRAPPDDGQNAGSWRSNEVEATIDCEKKIVSVRRLTAYPGPRASGNPTMVHSFAAADVKPSAITPKSTFAYLEVHLCRAG